MREAPPRGEAPLTVLEIVGNAIVGGMETAVLQPFEGLPRAQFRIHALCPFRSAFTDTLAPRVEAVHVAPMGEPLRWHTVQRAAGVVREARVDVVHAHFWTAHQVAALAGRLCDVPVLATVHGMHVTMADLEAHLLARTHLCVVGEAARAHALAVGAAAPRLHVIRNGVDVARFPPRATARAGPLTVGYVGRLSTEKNPALFVRAAARVHREHPCVRFAIVGDGPLRAELAALAHELGGRGAPLRGHPAGHARRVRDARCPGAHVVARGDAAGAARGDGERGAGHRDQRGRPSSSWRARAGS